MVRLAIAFGVVVVLWVLPLLVNRPSAVNYCMSLNWFKFH